MISLWPGLVRFFDPDTGDSVTLPEYEVVTGLELALDGTFIYHNQLPALQEQSDGSLRPMLKFTAQVTEDNKHFMQALLAIARHRYGLQR